MFNILRNPFSRNASNLRDAASGRDRVTTPCISSLLMTTLDILSCNLLLVFQAVKQNLLQTFLILHLKQWIPFFSMVFYNSYLSEPTVLIQGVVQHTTLASEMENVNHAES